MISEHAGLSKLFDECEKSPNKMRQFFEKLTIVSSEFENMVGNVDSYFNAVEDIRSQDFDNIFDSSHMRYLDDALEQFGLISSYSGPIYVSGIGLGASIALAVSALRSDRVKRCIAMSPLLEMHEFLPGAKIPFISNMGPLDLSPAISMYPNSYFPISSLTAAARFGRSISDGSKLKKLFRSGAVNTFFILTEEDDTADLIFSNDYFYECGGQKAGHCCFVYPKTHKVPHSMLDPTIPMKGMMNRYYESLYQNCFVYLETGVADNDSLMSSTSDPKLPIPPTAKRGRSDYYTKSYRSSSNSRFRA